MRRKILIVSLLVAIIFSGCNFGLTENEVQQAIDDALATSAAEQEQAPAPPSSDSEEADAALEAANQALTEQAAQILTQESELATLNAGPTATDTLPPETPTNTAEPTEPAPLIPEGQKIVIAKKNAPLWKVDTYNDNDYPIMIKLDPIVRYEEGDWILVYEAKIQADGGQYYYQVVGPIGGGYYILVGDVTDQTP